MIAIRSSVAIVSLLYDGFYPSFFFFFFLPPSCESSTTLPRADKAQKAMKPRSAKEGNVSTLFLLSNAMWYRN